MPQSALAFEKLFLEAGAPAGTYTSVFLSNRQTAVAIADSRIRGVALTSGIVLDDADMDVAIKWGVWATMNNAGQCCVAAKRFILDETVADKFISRFSKELAKLIPGDPRDDKTTLGPLCTQSALKARAERASAVRRDWPHQSGNTDCSWSPVWRNKELR